MFEILVVILFIWLLGKTIGLAFKLTWGLAKVAASILMAIALPLLILGLIVVGGVFLLLPVGLVLLALGVLKACT